MKTRVLILCTGNSARSQMAEGYLRSLDGSLDVSSAGTYPAPAVSPFAVRAMEEIGVDISGHRPKNVESFLGKSFDYVITVCDNARDSCPVFSGHVAHSIHLGFDDPALAQGTDDQIMKEFRRIRDQIVRKFNTFHRNTRSGMTT